MLPEMKQKRFCQFKLYLFKKNLSISLFVSHNYYAKNIIAGFYMTLCLQSILGYRKHIKSFVMKSSSFV